MRLHEEYLKRHDIRVPIVLYDKRSGVVLRTKEPPYKWRLLCVEWHHEEHWHPGSFYLTLNEVVNNSLIMGCAWLKCVDRKRLYWDEYEKAVVDLVLKHKEDYTVIDGDDLKLALCEIILQVCDGGFSKDLMNQVDSNFWNHAATVLDPSNPMPDRICSADKVISTMSSFKTFWSVGVRDVFKDEIRGRLLSSDWLVSLFKDENVLPCSS